MQVLDRLNMSELDDFEEFRKKAFSRLYFCPACVRSYDSAHVLDKCRFCGGAVQELSSKPAGEKQPEKSHRYYCTRCEKNYFSAAKPESCGVCGSRFIHSYEWKRIRRDIFRTRFRTLLRRLSSLQLPRSAAEKEFSLKAVQIRYPLPRLRFRRNVEELPTK